MLTPAEIEKHFELSDIVTGTPVYHQWMQCVRNPDVQNIMASLLFAMGEMSKTRFKELTGGTDRTTKTIQHERRDEMTQTLTKAQEDALKTILNLRRLTKETGTITTRAQNDVLRALDSKDIAAVANALAAM